MGQAAGKKVVATISIVAVVVTLGFPALADGLNMLLCLPGFPGTTSQAQPYIDKVMRHLESELGWAAGSMSGLYLPDGAKSATKLSSTEPALALVGPSVYAGQSKVMGMKVIARVVANGRGEETYSVITSKTGPSTLDELNGKKLSGAVVHDAKYVYNVLLDKQLAGGTLNLVSQKRPLKSLREVARGKVGAAIVDQTVVEHMSELPIAGDLRVIYTSKPVPAPAAVVMGEGLQNAAALKAALVGMCTAADGKELCKSLTITSIEAAGDADYKGLLKRYNR